MYIQASEAVWLYTRQYMHIIIFYARREA